MLFNELAWQNEIDLQRIGKITWIKDNVLNLKIVFVTLALCIDIILNNC